MEVSSTSKAPVQQAKPVKRVEPTQQAQQNAKAKTPEASKSAEAKPRPVVNTQGQTTGRLLHATA